MGASTPSIWVEFDERRRTGSEPETEIVPIKAGRQVTHITEVVECGGLCEGLRRVDGFLLGGKEFTTLVANPYPEILAIKARLDEMADAAPVLSQREKNLIVSDLNVLLRACGASYSGHPALSKDQAAVWNRLWRYASKSGVDHEAFTRVYGEDGDNETAGGSPA